ncbi:hypothetical protein JW752_03070 [Candidatus Peregrinibacteria bacterium]|nr:hypothetical protein [Candidatus Peregrinibacteria bacterium]
MEDPIRKYQDHVVDPKTQQELNKPLTDETGFNEGHEEFLNMLIGKLESGELDPYNVQTLHNKAVYDKLNEEEKEATDLTGMNILGIIRQIESLWKLEPKATFQIQNLVETVFQMKSRFEEKHGDVYII